MATGTSDVKMGGVEANSSNTNIDQSCSNGENAEKSGSQDKQLEEENVQKQEAQQKKKERDSAYEEAREVIERELGGSLRRNDLDDELAGTTLEEEELLLKQCGYDLR